MNFLSIEMELLTFQTSAKQFLMANRSIAGLIWISMRSDGVPFVAITGSDR